MKRIKNGGSPEAVAAGLEQPQGLHEFLTMELSRARARLDNSSPEKAHPKT